MKTLLMLVLAVYFSQFLTVNTQASFCTIAYNCTGVTTYTVDGSCNNLKRPWIGKKTTPLQRLLAPLYNDPDRLLRSKSSADNTTDLPNPRSIALAVHNSVEAPGVVTLLAVFFGQMQAHDYIQSSAATKNGTKISCDVTPSDRECLNIAIPPEDTLNLNHEPFITVTRTASTDTNSDCVVTDREPLNQLTNWADLSVIYGSDQSNSDSLRTKTDGLLLTQNIDGFTRAFFPPAADGTCVQESTTRKCFKSGESRPNENSIINSVQTLFLREHNRIAGIVKSFRPNYTDEEIFQATRKLLIAQYQHIIYNEWLPVIIGRDLARVTGLLPSSKPFRSYNPNINAALFNEFGTAAFRFGHTLVKSNYSEKDADYKIVKNVTLLSITNNPNVAYEDQGLDGLCRGAISDKANRFDSHLTDTVQNHLFEIFGTTRLTIRSSLSALNINRGRDHGLQPYVKYRELCGLPPVNSFDDLLNIPADTRANITNIYQSVKDIDLFTGGVSELPVLGGTVGPTFACIISKQFRNFKFGDRFYYENPWVFSRKQLKEIKTASMARIICDNLDVSSVPRYPFLPTPLKKFVKCSKIKSVDYGKIFRVEESEENNEDDDDDVENDD